MCLGVPGKVVLVKGKKVKVKQQDHYHWLDISALGQKVSKGDYLLSYQNTAINKINSKQAEEILGLIKGA